MNNTIRNVRFREHCHYRLAEFCKVIRAGDKNVCIVSRRAYERDKISKFLNENGYENRIVDDKTPGGNGINIATISRVKGLEFDNIIIWGLDKWMLNGNAPSFSNDPASSKETENSFRSGAYVAATRARKGLICFVKEY